MTANNTHGENTESRLMQDCFMHFHNSYPQYRDLYFEIHNNAFSARSGMKHKAMGRIPGVADACLLLPSGRGPVFIEYKTETGQQSEVQETWQVTITAQGYDYRVVRSLSQFKNLLTLLNL